MRSMGVAVRRAFVALVILAALSHAQVATVMTAALPRYYYCLMSVTELSKVDGVEQSFYVDTSFTCYYQEPGLTGLIPPNAIIPLPDAMKTQLLINNSFFEPQFLNKRNLQFDLDRRFVFAEVPLTMAGITLTNPSYPMAGTPWIAVTQRFSGLFKADLELRDFPFDSQTLWINVSSSTPSFMGLFAGPQWLPAGARVTAAVREVIGWEIVGEQLYNGTTFAADYGVALPDLGVAIRLKRVPNYYVNKIILGVVLITVMSQLTFLLSPRDSNRPMAALTAFLGIVTYLFVISTDVPRLAYLTRMDRFVNLSFYFVFGDFAMHLIFYVVVRAADDAEAKAMERAAEEQAQAADTEPFGASFEPLRAPAKYNGGNPIAASADAGARAAQQQAVGTPRTGDSANGTGDDVGHVHAAGSAGGWGSGGAASPITMLTMSRAAMGAGKAPLRVHGWWNDLRYYLRAVDFILLGTLIVCYTLGCLAILTGAST